MSVIVCSLFAFSYLINYAVSGDSTSLVVLNIYCAAFFVISARNKKDN